MTTADKGEVVAGRAFRSREPRRGGRWLITLLASVLLVGPGLMAAPRATASPPQDFQTSLVVGDGLDGPSGFEIAPDGRIFILERAGKIKIVKNGQLLPTPFADLPSEDTGDRGLIGIAFDPDFGVSNHFVYFYYTGHDLLNHLVRFSAAEDVAPDAPLELFRTSSPSQLLHVGGSIRFGADGKLYFAVGDNGQGDNAQDLRNPHGKILRINRDGSIPEDNPFVGEPGKLAAIWAYGFRNPWRFQLDSTTGELYGGDVGDFSWEELNHIVRGGNYGWPLKEGVCTANCAGFIDPIHAYPHDGNSSAVTGGPIYRAGMFPPEYQGDLFFADYARGFIKHADLDATGQVTSVEDFDDQAGSVVDMKVAPDGSLYYVTYFPGALYRVSFNTTSHLPVANASSDVTKGVEPLTVQFSSAGSNDPDGDPLSHHWDLGDGTTSTDANPTKTYPDKGVYTVRLTVSAGGDAVPAPPIVVQVGVPPELTLAFPTEGQLYRAGDTITYNAFAQDAAGFDLDDGDIKTTVRLHHGTHFHPFVGPLTGRAGSFTIPTTGEPSADTSYEVTVTATDSSGVSSSKVVNIFPHKSVIGLASSPSGLGVFVDGIPVSTPHQVTGAEGFQRELSARLYAVAQDGTELQFAGWSDGKPIRHTISTPVEDATYTAMYGQKLPFTAEYYDNITFSGAPVVTRQEADIDADWGNGSPDPALPGNLFAARWTKTQHFGAGRYTFTTLADDGVRLYIDGKRVISRWHGPANTEASFTVDLGEGLHNIKLDYVEIFGGGRVSLDVEAAPDQPASTYRAEYWNWSSLNEIPATSPELARDEEAIDHDWGPESPGPGIGPDRFLARWTRTTSFSPGDYEFAVTTDDGVRLFVDGVPVIDRWIDQGPTTYTATLPMDGAPHSIVMEYYENGGGAVADLDIERVGDMVPEAPYHASYWNLPDGADIPPTIPSGPPDLERDDETLDFDWDDGSPGVGIASNRFVARWTKTVSLSAGLYRFSGVHDDGMRAFIDNAPVFNDWNPGNTSFSVDKVVAGGTHELRVEHFDSGGGAKAEFTYERIGDMPTSSSDGGYQAEYFDNPDVSGAPVLTRLDDAVDFNWGDGAPGDGVPANNFSARWTKPLVVAEDTSYTFTVTADDGARLFIDGVKVLDKWFLQGGAATSTVTRHLAPGTHTVVLEYFELGGGAVARFDHETSAEPPPDPPPPFAAEYFDNADLAGTPVLVRVDTDLDFDWGSSSPDPAVPANGFSARWTRTQSYPAGTYKFEVTGDDGIRVLVDGVVVVDGWFYQAPTTYSADVPLTEGLHTVVVEYFEYAGGAVAGFSEARVADG
jgi:glucose/arabinose dehydrogenase/PKD repeat protein